MTLKLFVAAALAAASIGSGVADALSTYRYKNSDAPVTASITTTGNGLPACSPNTAQYSGFVNINATVNKKYFYWAFGPQSNRSDAPVILWMTGGPGCSSALAALVENGPCHLNTTTGELYQNPHGWNKDAFLIYIDQPAGVGFSTADVAGYDSNEEEVSEDMYWFLQEFLYTAHPEFRAKNNEFFVFGESYGGHYAPATAHKIFKRNEQSDTNTLYRPVNLVGLGVGNGLTNPKIQYQYYEYTAYDWCMEKLGTPCVSVQSAALMNSSLAPCLQQIDGCVADPAGAACVEARAMCNAGLLIPYTITGKNTYDIRKKCVGDLCYDLGKVSDFMNLPSTQQAFGVPQQTWSSCNMLINLAFMADWFAAFDGYVAEMLDGPSAGSSKAAKPVRTMIYVGEMDFVCNVFGNKAWTLAMDWNQKTQYNNAPDVPFASAGQPAAIVRSVAGQTGPMHFSFAHVFNAGHMVPMDQPAVMYDLLDRFVKNKGWGN